MNAPALKTLAVTELLPLLLLLALPAVAQAQFTYTTNNDQITITGYTGSGGAVTIPGTTNGHPVTSIGAEAFQFSTVTSVIIPDSVTNIEELAFDGCFGLTAITVDASNPAYSNVGLGGILYDKAQATLVQYPEGLSGTYSIPDSVTNIVDGALNNCLLLTTVNIAYSVLNIGNNFINCPSLMGFTVDGFNPNYYSRNGVLLDKAQVTLVRIPGGLVGSYTVAESVTSIATNAFEDSLLSVVVIPAGVTSIGSYAFYDCTRLTGVYFLGGSPAPNNDLTVFSGDTNAVVYYPPATAGWGALFDGLPTVLASNPSNYGDFNYLTINDQITLTGYTGPGGAVAVPDTINSYPVTTVNNNVFQTSTTLTSVTIPDSVIILGPGAFYECYNLTNATIGNSVASIGANTFYDCYRLTSVTIGKNVTSIGNNAFYDCGSLTSVNIPDSVTSIGGAAFTYCGSLTNATIGSSVASIGDYAFSGCTSLNSVTIPNSVTSIGGSAFFECYNLSSVIIGDGVTSIGNYAFAGCYDLTNITVAASNPDYSSLSGVLFDKAQVTLLQFPGGLGGSYTIPASVTSIGTGAFEYSIHLTSVNIPDSVTSIGVEAFLNCNIMISITIPASVTSIGNFAFSQCYNLKGIYFLGNSPTPNNDLTVFSGDNAGTVYYVLGTTGWGTLFDGWPTMPLNLTTNFNYTTFNNAVTITGYIGPAGLMIIPSTINGYPVTTIGYAAFNDNFSVTGVTILGTNLTSIEDDAFFQSFALTSITIPASVTSIGVQAFASSGLTSVAIPASVTSIGTGAFEYSIHLTAITVNASNPDYSSLSGVLFDKAQETLLQYPGGLGGSYTVPDSATSIGYGAFQGSSYLTSVAIPVSVTNIGVVAFNGCSALTNFTVDASNPDYSSLSGVLFDKAQVTLLLYPDGLNGSYNIPASVTSIGADAFLACTSLTSVTIPASVTSIGDNGFGYCYSLTNVTIGNGVTNIGAGVFYDCSSLTSVTIPDSVTSIGEEAFIYCGSLTNVTIGAGVTNIGSYAFYSCPTLTGVYFQGNSPTPTNDLTVFSGDTHGVVYPLPGATGWGTLFDGLPTALWLPQVQTGNGSFGVQSNQFGFNINWAGNRVVVVEAATNLANPIWIPVSTNTLTGGTSYFSDPQWSNYPGRYYRLSSP